MRIFASGECWQAAIPPRSRPGRHGNARCSIVQFYARSAEIIDGERDVICYGVRNAKAVRLEPPVETSDARAGALLLGGAAGRTPPIG